MTFGSLWGHFGVMMRICGGLEGPFSIWSLPACIFWRVKGATSNLNPAAVERAGPTFGGPVGSLGVTWGSGGDTWGSLGCPLGVT